MKKIILIALLISLIQSFSFAKEVLLIHSYHKGYKWTDDISLSIEQNLQKEKNVNLSTIYMDTKNITTYDYYEKLATLYQEQFKNRKFDLILVSDNNAFNFMIKYHHYLFKDVPVLFCGVNNYDSSFLQENSMHKYMNGVVENVNLEKNFELILKIHPKLKKLIIVNDLSRTGQAVRRDLIKILPKFKDRIKTIEYIDDNNIKEIQKKIKESKPEDTAILLILLTYDDKGKYLTYQESIGLVKNIKDIPIYGLWDFYLNNGIVGGLLTSAKTQGNSISKMAIEVLNGKNVEALELMEFGPNEYVFDYEQLEKYNIDIKEHVNKYRILNKPFSFYNEYEDLVNSVFIVFIIFIILIILMIKNIQRRKKVEINLSNQLKFDKVLLDTLPNPIYYKNKNGEFIGCNEAFVKLTNNKKENILGKTTFDFFPHDTASKNTSIDKKLLETLGTNISEVSIHIKNNKVRHFILSKAVYENMDGSVGGIVCIMDDITQRLQHKQFLIQQSKLAEMGDMIAAVAHQWNEPLVELSAQVQSIELSYMLKNLEDIQVKEFVYDSMIQIKYMSQTLSDFRNFLKPSTKKTLFAIRKSLDDIVEIIGKQIFYLNINLTIKYEQPNIDLLIYGFENEFKQVILNLINNAKNKIVKRNEESEFKGNITINISNNEDFNIIKITDDAGAISEDIINLIFDPYFTTKDKGTGIGLYMAKVIIEDKMSGKIYVKNDGDNVEFYIKIPNNNYGEM